MKRSFSRSKDAFAKKRACYFQKNKIYEVDFRDANLLKRFLTPAGKILPRRITGTSPFFHRQLTQAVKRARATGLMASKYNG